MLDMLRDLIAHKGYANAALLGAVARNNAAASDPELLALLHHVLLSNRFWLLSIAGAPFVVDDESRPPESFEALVRKYAGTQEREAAWLAAATESDLARRLEGPLVPGGACSVSQAFLQVCLHSHGHRSQCAKLLRKHRGAPPASDFISWLTARPAADWTDALAPMGTGQETERA